MLTREIKRNGWEQFCKRLDAAHRGSMVSIHLVGTDGSDSTIVEDEPLDSVILDTTSDGCSNHLVIKAGSQESKPILHDVVEPIHIRLKDGDNNRFNRLHILAENGTTVVELRPGLSPEVLDGLEIAE